MLLFNVITEIRIIYRNYWLAAITLLLITLCLYAGWNGRRQVAHRQENITAALNEMKITDELMVARLDSISKGLAIGLASWEYPSVPTVVGAKNPRVAAFTPGKLSFIATGQSDMFNHYVKPTLTDDSFSIAFTELTNPLTLLVGNFDLSFVLVYLLPLVIISFSYNILSGEKEKGSLLLIASSPINVRVWLFQKVLTRFTIVASLLLISLSLLFILNRISIDKAVFTFIGMALLYSVFWFMLAYVVNLRGSSSSKNSIVLLGFWIMFVLAIPSLINQSVNTLYPVPSRTMLINKMRNGQAVIDKEQDTILDGYSRNHPELTIRSADESTANGWWQRYFASKDLMLKKMTPLLTEYDQSLKKQQKWINQLSFLSPSVLFQNSLNHLAETSSTHYDVYRNSVITFTEDWRNFFLPLIFQQKSFTKEMIPALPKLRFNRSEIASPIATNAAILITMSLVLTLIGFILNKRRDI